MNASPFWKSLVEGTIEPADWAKWWKDNSKVAEKFIGADLAGKFQLRPDLYETAHNCQNVAEEVLKKEGIKAKRSMRYFGLRQLVGEDS